VVGQGEDGIRVSRVGERLAGEAGQVGQRPAQRAAALAVARSDVLVDPGARQLVILAAVDLDARLDVAVEGALANLVEVDRAHLRAVQPAIQLVDDGDVEGGEQPRRVDEARRLDDGGRLAAAGHRRDEQVGAGGALADAVEDGLLVGRRREAVRGFGGCIQSQGELFCGRHLVYSSL